MDELIYDERCTSRQAKITSLNGGFVHYRVIQLHLDDKDTRVPRNRYLQTMDLCTGITQLHLGGMLSYEHGVWSLEGRA